MTAKLAALAAVAATAWAQPATLAGATGRYSVVTTTIPVGPGDGELGLVPGGEDELPIAPSAIAVAPDGKVGVLDVANGRLALLEDKFKAGPSGVRSTVRLPQARFLRGLALQKDGGFYSFDARTRDVVGFDRLGTEVRRERLGTAPFDSLHVKGPPPLPVMNTVTAETQVSARDAGTLLLKPAGGELQRIRLEAPVPGTLVSATVIGVARGRVFVRLEVLETEQPIKVRRFIRVQEKNKVVDVFEYPVEGIVIGDQDVEIDANGRVFVLLPRLDRVEVQRWEPQ